MYRAPTLAVDDNEVEDEDGDDHHYLLLALDKGSLWNICIILYKYRYIVFIKNILLHFKDLPVSTNLSYNL